MIFPWLRGILSWSAAPLTWALVALNVLIFLVISDVDQKLTKDKSFNSAKELIFTGRLYMQFNHQDPAEFDETQIMAIGSRALHDSQFLSKASQFPFKGDQIAIKEWQENLFHFSENFKKRSSWVFGLSQDNQFNLSWITYQFVHAGFFHLMSNIFMLLLFGSALEGMIGSVWLMLLYIASGLAGGLGFFVLANESFVPVVGASGALTGIMAFYFAIERKKSVSFFFFLSPVKEYFGWIHLPKWTLLPIIFLPDLVGYLGTPEELGSGVAYTAHIGGAALGFLLGFLYRSKTSSNIVLTNSPGL